MVFFSYLYFKEFSRNRKNSKTGRLDIRAKFNDGEDCDIELQVEPFPFMDKRMLEYWSSMHDAKINSGDLYSVLKPSISILITDYRVPKLEHISKYHTKWNLREEEFKDTILTDEYQRKKANKKKKKKLQKNYWN